MILTKKQQAAFEARVPAKCRAAEAEALRKILRLDNYSLRKHLELALAVYDMSTRK